MNTRDEASLSRLMTVIAVLLGLVIAIYIFRHHPDVVMNASLIPTS